MSNIIWQDLEFFLTRLKDLPVSKSLTLDDKNGSFCVSTGCSFESWVYYPARVTDPEMVKSVINFFKDENISFMWPVYNGGEKVLEDCGLMFAGNLTAMSYTPQTYNFENNLRIYETDSVAWAQTAWHGFGGGAFDTPKNYYKLVEAIFNDKEHFKLYLTECEGENVGTFLTTNEKDLMGVYYFATIPEYRRQGAARAMMNEICRLAFGKTIVLQATPMGLPFYKKFGFEERFIIPIYSTESDIF